MRVLCVHQKVDLFGVKDKKNGKTAGFGARRLAVLETILPTDDKFVVDIQQFEKDPALIRPSLLRDYGRETYSAEISVYHRSSPDQEVPHVFILPHLLIPPDADWATWIHKPSELARMLIRQFLDRHCLDFFYPTKWNSLTSKLTRECSNFNVTTDTRLDFQTESQSSSISRLLCPY